MVPKWVEEIAEASRALGLKPKVVRVRSAKASRELPTPYGVFSIIYDGKLIAERPISATRFTNIMSKFRVPRFLPGLTRRRRKEILEQTRQPTPGARLGCRRAPLGGIVAEGERKEKP